MLFNLQNVNGLMMPLLNVQNVENVYENVENPGPSTSGRTAPAPLNVIEPEVRNDLPVEPDFLGFDDDSSDDGYNSEFWRLQLQADLPETDDDSTYSPSHVQIFIPEGLYDRPNIFSRFVRHIKASLFIF